MIISKKKILAVIIFIITINLITINSINDYIYVANNTNDLSHSTLVYHFIASGQKLNFNLMIYLSIIMIAFPWQYKNEFFLTRIRNMNTLHNKIVFKNLMLSIMVLSVIAILQIIMWIIYNFEFNFIVLIDSCSKVFLYSFTTFSLYNVLYHFKINNYLSVGIIVIFRFLSLILALEIAFSFFSEGAVDLILNGYILLELIITNYISIYIINKKKDFIL